MNAEQAKFLAEHYARVLEQEVPTTAKVLAAVNHGNRDYKPDPKSRSAFELAQRDRAGTRDSQHAVFHTESLRASRL